MICFSSSFPEWKMFSTLVLPKYFLYYFFNWPFKNFKISLQGQLVRKLPANSGDTRDTRSVPGMIERSPEVENGNLLQYSCLENSTNRGAWQAKIHRVTHTHTHTHTHTRSYHTKLLVILIQKMSFKPPYS